MYDGKKDHVLFAVYSGYGLSVLIIIMIILTDLLS